MTGAGGSPRFPWGLTAVTAVALVLLLSLGVWQVRRLAWKEGLIASAETVATAPPVTVPDPRESHPDDEPLPPDFRPYPPPVYPEFQRVIVSCDWSRLRFVELQSIHDGRSGVRIISACKGFLVDRGFIADTVTARPWPSEGPDIIIPIPPKPTPVLAQARTAPRPTIFSPPPQDARAGKTGKLFFARSHAAMARELGLKQPARQTLFALSSTMPDVPGVVAEAPPVAYSNNHLGYALTWFGLAIALVGFYIALLRRRPQAARRRAAGDRAKE